MLKCAHFLQQNLAWTHLVIAKICTFFSMKPWSNTTVISICLGTVNKKPKVVVQGFDASNEDDSLPNKNESSKEDPGLVGSFVLDYEKPKIYPETNKEI